MNFIYTTDLWANHKKGMSEDFLYHAKQTDPKMEYNENIFNDALISLEDDCIRINNKTLSELGMISPNRNPTNIRNRDYIREKSFNQKELQKFLYENTHKLNENQKEIYTEIMQKLDQNKAGIYFIDAPGGTGKTFLINVILAEVRIKNNIALAVASSGIASTLMDGGRTAHSMFKIPLNIQQIDNPTCNITRNSG